MASGQGTMYSIFSGGKLNKNDVTAITNYANAMKGGANSVQAWSTGMNGASVAAKQYVLNARKAGKSTDEMVAGLKQVPKATNAASVGLKALSVAGSMLMSMGIAFAITKIIEGIQWLATSSERAKEAASELADELNTQKSTIEGNISTVSGLEEEFERLSKGVDDYGANISLSADEYRRYQQIVQQIVGISPSLISGYDKEGNAIANKNGLIEQSIALLKEENRQRVENATSEETIKTLGKGKVEEYKDVYNDYQQNTSNALSVNGLIKEMTDPGFWGSDDSDEYKKGKWIADFFEIDESRFKQNYRGLSDLISKADFDERVEELYGRASTATDIFTTKDLQKFKDYIDQKNSLSLKLETASKALNPTLQMVPQSLTVYDELTDKQKAFVSEYVNTFKITADTTDADIKKMRQDILDFTEAIGNASPETKKAIDDLFSLDKAKISAAEWEKQINDLINQIVDSLTFESEEDKNAFVKLLKIRLGIEFTTDGETSVSTMLEGVKEKVKDEFDSEVDKLGFDELKIAYNIIAELPEGTLLTWGELKKRIDAATQSANKMTVSLKGISDARDELDKLFKAYEDDMELTTDEVADILEEHPEYIQYLTKVGDKYKVNQKALDDWNEAKKEQQRLIDEQMGSNQYAEEYNPLLDSVSRDTSSTKSDGDGNWDGGKEALDELIVKNKELNQSFADGKISATDYFKSLSDSITDSGLEQALDDLNGKFDETTDYIEATVSVLANELSDAMIQASKRFNLGKTSLGDYIDELDGGLDAQMKLLKSTYDLEVGENGLVEVTEDMEDATKQAAESFNEAFDLQDDIDVVNEFADAMESYNDRIMQYVNEDNITLTDAILGDVQLFSTHMDNVTDSLIAFAGTSAENFNTVSQQIQNALNLNATQVQELIGTSWEAVAENGDALQAAVGDNMSAANILSQGMMENAKKTVTNASQAVGGVLTALGNAISNFDYTLTFSFEGDVGLFDSEGNFDPHADAKIHITGSGGSSVGDLAKSLTDAGTYFSSQTNNDAGGYSGYTPTTKNTTPAAKRPETEAADAKKAADDAKKAEEERIKKENEAFKAGLETRKKVLERYKDSIDLTDFGLDVAEEDDFALRADLLNSKMSQITSYGEAMRKEFDRVTKIIPQTSEQADALASHIESLGDDMRANVTLLRETRIAMEQLKIDSIVSVGDYYLEDLNSAISDIESRIERLSNDNNEDYEYTNKILNMKALLPTRSGTKDVRNERREADQDIIRAEQDTQDAINDIIETQIKKNEALREDERTAILNEMKELRADTQIKLTEFQDDIANSCDIVAEGVDSTCETISDRIDSTDVQFPDPSIDFSKAEKQFDSFGKVVDKLEVKASDLADSLNRIAEQTGEEVPKPMPGKTPHKGGMPFEDAKDAKDGADGKSRAPENNFDEKLKVFEEKINEWLDKHAYTGDGYPFAQKYPITSHYGWRIHPIQKTRKFHSGVDFGAPYGTNILSVSNGTVSSSGVLGGYGNAIIIKGLDGISWLYAHMAQPSPHRVGTKIIKGQPIGIVGSTGNSTGPHLHLERRGTDGSTSNPLKYLPYYATGTPKGNIKAKRFGIAGENFKPEILVDKTTGETTYIDKPTVFDLSTTDVIGEKATAKMPKFASGTLDPMEVAAYIRKTYPEITDAGIAGLLGNIMMECSFNPKASVIEAYGSGSNAPTWRGGLFQLDDGRIKDFNPNITWSEIVKNGTWQQQIDVALAEAKSGSGISYDAFTNILTNTSLSPADAARLWDAKYERSSGSVREERAAYAEQYYKQITKGAIDSFNTISENAEEAQIKKTEYQGRENKALVPERTPAEKSVIAEMKANSEKWLTASDSEKQALADKNKELGDSIDAFYVPATGKWYDSNGNSLYNSGSRSTDDIQKFVNEEMTKIDKATSDVTAKSIKISNDESLNDEEKALQLFKMLTPAAEEGRKIAYESYQELLSQFQEWWKVVEADPSKFSQETFDAYMDGLDTLEDKVLGFENTIVTSKERMVDIMENSLSEIDDYIDEHKDDGDWSLVGDTEVNAIRRKMDIIQKYRDEGILSEKEYQRRMRELRDDEVDAEFENSSNWIEKRKTKGDWALYGDSEYEAWQRVVKWLKEKYPEELDKIHEAEQNGIDARFQHSTNWIEERKTKGDWGMYEDSESEAWKRVAKWLREEYPDEIDKIKEAEQNAVDAKFQEDVDWIAERNEKGDWELLGDNEVDAWKRVIEGLQKETPDEIDKIKEAQKNLVNAEEKAFTDYIAERNEKGDWALYGESEYEAWQRYIKLLREEYPDELDRIKKAEQNAINARFQHSTDWIAERNTYNDWDLFGDSEVKAWERVVKWLNEEYPDEIEKIKQAEKSLFDARKTEIEESISDIEDYIKARNAYDDWDKYGDSEVKAIQRITEIIEDEYEQRFISYEEYIDKLEDQSQRIYSLGKNRLDEHLSDIDKYIDARNFYDDWDKFGNTEVNAIRKQLKILKEAYNLNLISYEDYTEKYAKYTQKLYSVAKNNIIEEVSKLIEDYEEIKNLESSRLESQKTLLQSYYDVSNAVSDAQHEISKELKASMTMHEYLNEETRKLLFTQEDYNVLNKELLEIQSAADALQRQYQEDILNANAETIAEITSQYQMQYNTMMKQYEISKAELEVSKKRQQLDNVLAERNTRMFINGQWQWVAKTQDVINAQNELADAEVNKNKQEALLEQTESIDEFTAQINAIETDLSQVRKYWSDMQEMLNGESDEVAKALKNISKVASPELKRVIGATSGSVTSFSSTISESTTAMSNIIYGDRGFGTMADSIHNIITDLETYSDAIQALTKKADEAAYEKSIIAKMKANSEKWFTASESEKQALADKNKELGDSIGAKYNSASGKWYDSNGNLLYSVSSSSGSSSSSSSSSSGRVVSYSPFPTTGKTVQVGADGNAPAGTNVGDTVVTAGGKYLVVAPGTEYATKNEASGLWSIKIDEEDANGTRYTSGGMTLMGEEGFEAYITDKGRLIPITQPTIGNIGSGGVVFNREQLANLRNLWDLSNLSKVSPFVSSSNANSQTTVIDNSIQINGMTISEKGNEDWINGFRRYVATHK